MPAHGSGPTEAQRLIEKLTALGPGPWPLTRRYLARYLILNIQLAHTFLWTLREPHDWVGQGPDPTVHLIDEQQRNWQWHMDAYMELADIPAEALTDWWMQRLGLGAGEPEEGKK